MKGIIINSDVDGILKGKNMCSATAEQIADFAKEFEGTQITDYFINVASTCVTYHPSKVATTLLDKFRAKVENGIPVDYSDNRLGKAMYHIFEELKVDHNQLMIEGFKKVGINPWISFRMNDFHSRDKETWFGASDFYYEHPEVRRIKFHPEFIQSNADRAYDYSYEIVREHIKGIIDEALDRYDPYGIELDFQRDIYLFGMGRDHFGCEIMDGFMHEVDEIVHKYEKKYGHEIKIAMHIASDVQSNFDFGLDIVKWAREGIIDMVIPAGRWSTTDNDLPIKLWKSLLEPYGTIVAAGMDWRIEPYPHQQAVTPNIETFAAFAANAYEQGADKIYIFNYFRTDVTEHFDKEAEFVTDPEARLGSLPVYWTVINKLGSPETIKDLNRHHIITYSDTTQFWVHSGMNRQLPVTFPGTRGRGFKIGVGMLPEGAKLTIRFALKDEEQALADIPTVFANSEACEYIGSIVDERFTKHRLFCYSIPASAYETVIYPYIMASKETTVEYVDLIVKVSD